MFSRKTPKTCGNCKTQYQQADLGRTLLCITKNYTLWWLFLEGARTVSQRRGGATLHSRI